LVSWRC